jgi:hypothetical protein
MVSKVDQLLDDMRRGTPSEQLDDGSKSSYYKAYALWKPEADAAYSKITNDILAAKKEKILIQGDVEHTRTVLTNLKQTTATAQAELDKTSVAHISLQKKNAELQAKNDAINSELADLLRRNITEKSIEAVASTDASSDAELLARVKTVEDNRKLGEENAKLEAKKTRLINDVAKEAAHLETAKLEAQSAANARDEFLRVNALYLTLLDLLFSFFKRGYTFDDFRMLLAGLKKLEIAGQTKNSMARLITALEKTATLQELDANIQVRQATLAKLQGTINELQGIMNAYRDGAVATMNQVSAAATKNMDALLNRYLTSMNTLLEKITNTINMTSASTQTDRATMMNAFTYEVRKAKNEVLNLHEIVCQAIQVYQGEVRQWGGIMTQAGRYEQLIENASALVAATKDPKIIKRLPADFVVSLLKGDRYLYTSQTARRRDSTITGTVSEGKLGVLINLQG